MSLPASGVTEDVIPQSRWEAPQMSDGKEGGYAPVKSINMP